MVGGRLSLTLDLSATRVDTRHDAVEDVVGRPQVTVVHDQTIALGEVRLGAELGLSRRLALGAVLPVRLVDTSIRYLDAATGDEVTLVTPETHHRDETRTAIADPWLLARAALERGPYTLDLRAGVTVPLARTEEDPFAAEAMGAEHEHIQFGTGTFNPVLGAEGHYLADRFSLGVWGVTQQVLYESAKGYQAGDRYAAGAAVESRLGLRAWSFRIGPEMQAESRERWHGVAHTDEGNQGRVDVLAAAGVSWWLGEGMRVTGALKVPVWTHVIGGQVEYPVLVQLGVAGEIGLFGGAAAGAHGHEGEGEHGHDDGHGHGDGHEGGADWTGGDVAEVARAGEAVDLVPVAGKVTVFDFWAEWCVPCKRLDELLIDAARRHPGRLAIRRVNVVDWDSPAARRYLAPRRYALPHVVVTDAAGTVRLERSGTPEALAAAVEALTSGGSP